MKKKFSVLLALVLVLSLSLVTAVPVAAEPGEAEGELVGSYSYSWTTTIMDCTDFDFTVGMGWLGVGRPGVPNVYFFFHPDEIPLGGWTEPIGGAWLFENIDFDITAAGQTFSVTSVADDPDFAGFASLLTNSIDEEVWFGYIGDRDNIASAGGQKGVKESQVFSGTDVGTDFPGYVIKSVSLTFNQIYLDPENVNKLVLDFTVDIYAGPLTEVWVDDDYFDGGDNDGHIWGLDAFATIQDGINTVAEAGTVNVAAGTYTENVVIDEALTVKSTDGAKQTIIVGKTCYVVSILHSDVTFEGFTVTNPEIVVADPAGIRVADPYSGWPKDATIVNNVYILNNIVKAVGASTVYGATGINIGASSDVVISGNTIENIKDIKEPEETAHGPCGINVWGTAEVDMPFNIEISHNEISGIYNGILLQYASDVSIENNNTITGCEIGIMVEPFEGATVSNLAILDNIITDFHKGGIVVKDVPSVQIEGNIISTTDYSVAPNGIQIGYEVADTGTIGTVKDNQVSGCHWSGYNPGLGYEASGNWTGSGILVIDTKSELEISGNEVQGCDVGLDIEAGIGTLITNNDVHNNSYGFVLWNANPTINYNNIYQNALCGVYRTSDLGGTLDAINNWWGHPSGPSHSPGYGDKVSGGVVYDSWLLGPVVPGEPLPTTFDKTLALNIGWTLVSTDNWIDPAETVEVGVILTYNYTPSLRYFEATPADLVPVDALYLKTEDGGAIGIKYSGGVPVASSKDLEAGWNLISSATITDAKAVLSPLRHVQVGVEQGIALTTVVSQGDYNQHSDSFYLATLGRSDWNVLGTTMLNPFDGYWVYMNAAKSFGVVPGAQPNH